MLGENIFKMRWDYIFFVMFLYPILKGLYFYAFGKSDEVWQKRKDKLDSLTKEKRIIYSSSRSLITVIPYSGAYYYADYRYIWLSLGIIYLLTAVITLVAALGVQSLKQKAPETYERAAQQSKEELKNVNFWPKWQVHAYCMFNISVLVLWLYSWRYLFT